MSEKVTKSMSSESDMSFQDCDDLVESETSEEDLVEVEDVPDAEELRPVQKNSFIP